jgi:hypothetical protein
MSIASIAIYHPVQNDVLNDSSYHAGVLSGNALKKKKANHLISLGMYTEPIGSGSADRKTPASQSGWTVCLLDQVTDIRGRQPADLCGHRKSGHCHAHQGRARVIVRLTYSPLLSSIAKCTVAFKPRTSTITGWLPSTKATASVTVAALSRRY